MSLTEWTYREARTPKASTALSKLNDRQRAILCALVHGLEGKTAEKHGLEAGKALTAIEAAAYFKTHRKYVRELIEQPLFKAEMAQAIANKRLSLMPHCLDRIAELADSDNESIALRAAETILGERTAQGVSVTLNNQTNIANFNQDARPGYIVRLPPIPNDPNNQPP